MKKIDLLYPAAVSAILPAKRILFFSFFYENGAKT